MAHYTVKRSGTENPPSALPYAAGGAALGGLVAYPATVALTSGLGTLRDFGVMSRTFSKIPDPGSNFSPLDFVDNPGNPFDELSEEVRASVQKEIETRRFFDWLRGLPPVTKLGIEVHPKLALQIAGGGAAAGAGLGLGAYGVSRLLRDKTSAADPSSEDWILPTVGGVAVGVPAGMHGRNAAVAYRKKLEDRVLQQYAGMSPGEAMGHYRSGLSPFKRKLLQHGTPGRVGTAIGLGAGALTALGIRQLKPDTQDSVTRALMYIAPDAVPELTRDDSSLSEFDRRNLAARDRTMEEDEDFRDALRELNRTEEDELADFDLFLAKESAAFNRALFDAASDEGNMLLDMLRNGIDPRQLLPERQLASLSEQAQRSAQAGMQAVPSNLAPLQGQRAQVLQGPRELATTPFQRPTTDWRDEMRRRWQEAAAEFQAARPPSTPPPLPLPRNTPVRSSPPPIPQQALRRGTPQPRPA